MIFDSYGLPRDTGASDFQDSSRAAGLCVLFGLYSNIKLELYTYNGMYFRHPHEVIYTMSRDQTICLFAGMWAQKRFDLVNPYYDTEGDIISPGVRGHFRRCKRLKSTFFQDAWLMADIYINAWFFPMSEPNQLICQLMTAEDNYPLRAWCKLNKKWREAIREYWCGWRGEQALADRMISVIESKI